MRKMSTYKYATGLSVVKLTIHSTENNYIIMWSRLTPVRDAVEKIVIDEKQSRWLYLQSDRCAISRSRIQMIFRPDFLRSLLHVF